MGKRPARRARRAQTTSRDVVKKKRACERRSGRDREHEAGRPASEPDGRKTEHQPEGQKKGGPLWADAARAGTGNTKPSAPARRLKTSTLTGAPKIREALADRRS